VSIGRANVQKISFIITKWYNEIKAWKIDVTNNEKNVTQKSTKIATKEIEEDLPF
jgi:hypothetical protein